MAEERLAQLERALVNADKAGDAEAARALAAEIKRERAKATPKKKPKSTAEKVFDTVTGALSAYGQYSIDQVTHLPESAANVATGIYQAVRHPIQTGMGALDVAAGTLRAVTPEPIREVIDRAGNEEATQRAANAASAAGNFYKERYGSVPAAIETFRTDPVGAGLDAYAVGSAGNALLRRAAPQFHQRISTPKPAPSGPAPAAKITPADKIARAKDFDIDLSVGDARGLGSKLIERNLDVVPGSAAVMDAKRAETAAQVSRAAGGTADKFGPTTDFRGVGEAVQRGARSWLERFSGENGVTKKLFDNVKINKSAPVSTTNTQRLLSDLSNVTPSNAVLNEMLANPVFSKYLRALKGTTEQVPTGLLDDAGNPITRTVAKGGNLTWADLKAFRSDIGEQIADAVIIGEKPARMGQLKRLYGALSTDMEAAARAQGPAAFASWQRADRIYKSGMDRVEKVFTKILGKDDALRSEAVSGLMQRLSKEGKSSADIKMLVEIRKSMPADEWGRVQNGIVRLMGQPSNSAGRPFDAGVFVRNFDDMTPAAKSLLFENSALRQNLERFTDVMRDVAASNATRNTSKTAQGVGGSVTLGGGAWVGSSIAGLPGAIGGVIATQYGYYRAALLWTNPKFIEWATGFAKATKAGKASAVRSQVAKLNALGAQIGMKKEMAFLANNIEGILDRREAEYQKMKDNQQPE